MVKIKNRNGKITKVSEYHAVFNGSNRQQTFLELYEKLH